MIQDRLQTPEHLSEKSKALWAELVPKRARSVGRITMLQTALECLDVADRARAEMEGTSLTTKTLTTGTLHTNPLLKVQREALSQFAKLWSALGLEWSHMEDGVDLERWLERQRQLQEEMLR